MNRLRDLDQMLTEWLDDPYTPPAPRYLPEELERTRHIRQRPAWSSLERWLPMTVITRRNAAAQPWRSASSLLPAVFIATALTVGAAIIGSQLLVPTAPADDLPALVVPEPFGPARNGLIAYGSQGDIHVYDPVTGGSRPLVAEPEVDLGPVFSPDGTRLAFAREDGGSHRLMVADADGSNILQLTPDPLVAVDSYAWSPDGSQIALSSQIDGRPTLQLVQTDGSGVDVLETGMPSLLAGWQPTLGTELLFRGTTADGVGLYSVRVGGGTPELILAGSFAPGTPGWDADLQFASYSPDGSQIVYSSRAEMDESGGVTDPLRIHLVNADGSGDRILDVLGAGYEDRRYGPRWAAWSPDGTRVSVVVRTGYKHQLAIVPVDGGGPVVASEPRPDPDGMGQVWSADGTEILTWRVADGIITAVDAATGAAAILPWRSDANPDWQRLAP